MGLLAIVGSAALAARLIWEQTVWSWERGPQMVGFSLAHGGGAILFLFPLVLVGWLVLLAVLTALSLAKKQRISRLRGAGLVVALVVLTALWPSYGFWQRLFAARLAIGLYAAKFLVLDAATGDLSTVKALLSHGVPVDARDMPDGQTALHGAAVEGQVKVIEYLVSRGADVNAMDGFGDSPLEVAITNKHNEAAQVLADHGGRRIRGDDARRRKVTEDIVRKDMESMERLRR
jgi:hypothetical protein